MEDLSSGFSKRMEIYLDEASNLITEWLGAEIAKEQPALVIQMAAAMLHRETAEVFAEALKSRSEEKL